ncbi:MAG: TetR/AcrR family transcriptional regulator [Myxococcales bacterium]
MSARVGSNPKTIKQGLGHQTKRDLLANTRQRALRSDAKASHKALVSAARDLFAERGSDGLTIVEVAKRAGLNRSTAYQHFRNREELSQAVAEDIATELGELMKQPRGLAEQIDFFVHYFEEHPNIARLWMFHLLANESQSRRGWGSYLDSLEQITKSPNSLPGIDAEMLGVISLTSSLVWSVMASQRTGSKKSSAEETNRFAGELKRLFLAGTRKPDAPKTGGQSKRTPKRKSRGSDE